ncbi:MAG: hypothetical protein LBM98_12965 [Oscillospiraceae bacterium]|nr:hypothetical protein [Oscillospiraceae bacterium]
MFCGCCRRDCFVYDLRPTSRRRAPSLRAPVGLRYEQGFRREAIQCRERNIRI